ncbi:MAG: GNAT family N-acetyltransferase [Clostridiales bacterium]|nr:GNAT family N-acetyltransferase [Clostridiales bacterium]
MDKNIRKATEKDVGLILEFIKQLADYEKMLLEVVADENLLKQWLFDKGIAQVIFALDGQKEVGFALYFYNFSTFLGRGGIYLEDLFVLPKYRKKGYGKLLLSTLAKIAVENSCGRVEWACLEWNKPSIDFYNRLGAIKLDEWRTFRLTGKELENLAKG